MKIKFLGTNSRAKMAHPYLSIDSLTPPPPPPPRVIKVFKAVKVFAPCLRNEAVNQLKANFIYWKDAVFLHITHTAWLFVHTLKGTYPHLYGIWYYKKVKVFIISICEKLF